MSFCEVPLKENAIMNTRIIALLVSLSGLISGCAPLAEPMVPVPVSGINYTDKGFSYIFEDPNNGKIDAGGEDVSPYGAGGTMCCYPLPAKWHAGITVKIKLYDDHGDFARDVLAEVGPYPDGKAGQLWAALYPDGSVEAISSNFDPPHANWPGKIKGWPRPSIAYRRKLWQREVDFTKVFIENAHRLLSDPSTSPELRRSAQENLSRDTEYLKQLESIKP